MLTPIYKYHKLIEPVPVLGHFLDFCLSGIKMKQLTQQWAQQQWVYTSAVTTSVCVILFIITSLVTKLPWPADNKGNFQFSSQVATHPPAYYTRWRLQNVPYNAERQERKLYILRFIVFGLTRPRIEPDATVSVADALSI